MNKNPKKAGQVMKRAEAKKVKFTPEQAKIENLHHKYRGKQRCAEAKKIRRELRAAGIYLSRLGHGGGLHD